MTRTIERLNDPIPLRLDNETEQLLNTLANLKNETRAEIMRRIISEGVRKELMLESGMIDEILSLIRTAMRDTYKPFEERSAKLQAKTAIAAATTMYTNLEVLGESGRKDIREVHIKARKKAVAFVRSTDEESEERQSGDLNE